MINLRQDRWLGPGFPGFGRVSFAAAAVVCAGLWLPGAAVAAAPHTHAHKPLPTALHSSTVSDAATHPAGKHGKSAAKAPTRSRAGAHSAGARASEPAVHKGKRGKGRPQPAEDDDPPIPMYRAQRSGRSTQRGAALLAREKGRSGAGGRWANHPAPLVSKNRHTGSGYVEVAEARPARSLEAASGSRPLSHLAAHPDTPSRLVPAPHWASSRPDSHAATPAASSPSLPAQPKHPDVAAEGFSHPEDDERLPRDRTVMGEDAPASPAPVVRISAAPTTPAPMSPGAVLPQSPVVQGFGGEIAVPSAGADRPGGTRRRSHPSNWQPESKNTPPEPLEEREAITYAAISPAVLPELYDHDGRLVMPAPLKGSHDVLVHQNVMANSDGLERIYDDGDLERMRASRQLVSFPVSESLHVNEDLPPNRRVARPWTVMFATDISHAFFQRFHQPLQVNSAVRTVRFQARLQMVNGNAAATSGDAASPHLTGQAIDFGKRGLSPAEMAWMRGFLLPLMQAGKIDVEEEFQQACFHISVYRSYASGRRPAREYAQVHADAAENTSSDVPVRPRVVVP